MVSLAVFLSSSEGSGWGAGISPRTMFISSLKVKDDILAPYNMRVGKIWPISSTWNAG